MHSNKGRKEGRGEGLLKEGGGLICCLSISPALQPVRAGERTGKMERVRRLIRRGEAKGGLNRDDECESLWPVWRFTFRSWVEFQDSVIAN